jgi:transcriptional regulator with XRE-family HTH domain
MSTQNTESKRITTLNTTRLPLLRQRDNNISKAEFAEKHGITNTLVSKIECGEKGLSLDLAVKLSDSYHVSLDWLYNRSDETKDKATSILMDLRNIFKIAFSTKVYESKNGVASNKYSTLSIDKHLSQFLMEIEEAEKVMSEGKMPENIYCLWVEDIKQKYNNLLDN